MKKSFIIVFLSLIVLVALFMFLRPSDTPKLPIQGDENMTILPPDFKDVRKFSDTKKNVISNKNVQNKTGKIMPIPTPKPLPYPRITINYSIQRTGSIRSNEAGINDTFVIIMLDIRNYGYRYFDAFSNNFRTITTGDNVAIPLVNISTGNMIDDVIPNNSRAKGDLIFLISNKKLIKKLIFSSINKSENYYIIYKIVKPSEIEDKKEEGVVDDEDDWR